MSLSEKLDNEDNAQCKRFFQSSDGDPYSDVLVESRQIVQAEAYIINQLCFGTWFKDIRALLPKWPK